MSKTIDISVENNGTEVIIVSLERVGVEARVGNVERSITVDFGSLPQNIYWDEIQDKPNFHAVATSGDYNDLENTPNLHPVATSGNYNDLSNRPNLKPVSTSGDYDDLSDKPQINGVTLQGNKTTANLGLATASQGALADTAYQKPQDGIPKSDLSSGVQASLNKADTALQEHQSLAGYATQSWVEDQGYLTQHQDISGKEDKSNKVTSLSSSSTDTQYPSAKVVYDQLATKQATLVSGTNIKTINNESILGSGNIEIQGGGSEDAVLYTEQTLTSEQKEQARTNIDAGTVTAVYYNGREGDFEYSTAYGYAQQGHIIISRETLKIILGIEDKLDRDELYASLGYQEFDSTDSYSEGAIVVYDGNLYKFISDHSGAWDENDVTAIGLTDVFDSVENDISDVEIALNGKQNVILDLSTIRSGAAAGATAYQKPSGGIPKTDLASGVQTSLGKADTALQEHQSLAGYATQSWVEDQGYITEQQDISGKADKVSSATNGHFAGLNGNGNLTDSGYSASDFATAIQAVPSGGTTGQVLAKASNSDNDVEWVDQTGGGGTQVQSDWNQTDTTAVDYIKNKPSVLRASFSYDSTNEAMVITPASATQYQNENLTIL